MRTADHVLAMRIEEGAAGYGIYVMLLELLRDSETRSLVLNPRNLAFAINEPDSALVERVIREYSLFTIGEDNTFTSPWLEQQMQEYDEKKKAASEAGRRGAAKRYGQVVGQKPATDSDPIGTPCPPPLLPHSNITNNINKTDKTNSKSKLLALTWGEMTGEDLFNLARTDEGEVDEITARWARGIHKEFEQTRGFGKFNVEGLLEICEYFHLGTKMLTWLIKYSNYAQVGTRQCTNIFTLYSRCRDEKFTPRFPAEYILVKLIQQ